MKKLKAIANWKKFKTDSLSERQSWHNPFLSKKIHRNHSIILRQSTREINKQRKKERKKKK